MVLSKNKRIFLRTGFTDMRKQINGLSEIAQSSLPEPPLSGAYFAFCGKTKRVIKILYCTGTQQVFVSGRNAWKRIYSHGLALTKCQAKSPAFSFGHCSGASISLPRTSGWNIRMSLKYCLFKGLSHDRISSWQMRLRNYPRM